MGAYQRKAGYDKRQVAQSTGNSATDGVVGLIGLNGQHSKLAVNLYVSVEVVRDNKFQKFAESCRKISTQRSQGENDRTTGPFKTFADAFTSFELSSRERPVIPEILFPPSWQSPFLKRY
jgi:hypothetical protein